MSALNREVTQILVAIIMTLAVILSPSIVSLLKTITRFGAGLNSGHAEAPSAQTLR